MRGRCTPQRGPRGALTRPDEVGVLEERHAGRDLASGCVEHVQSAEKTLTGQIAGYLGRDLVVGWDGCFS